MPTYEVTRRFLRDYDALTPEQQAAFRRALAHFVHDLKAGQIRAGLRVKPIRGASGLLELSWAPDGRATFEYGPPRRTGEVHIVWRRCGTHAIFTNP